MLAGYGPGTLGCSEAGLLLALTMAVEMTSIGAITQRTVLDAIEALYPMLRGTLRDHLTQQRRPFVRFFADARDLSLTSPDVLLPMSVADGREPLLVVGAMAGG